MKSPGLGEEKAGALKGRKETPGSGGNSVQLQPTLFEGRGM
jgi:hypothetical protein